MPMWRCPHCGTPQAETARCWVCRRSSTACGTCRNFRHSVAGSLGYCGLDHRRQPLVGDEIRACWEARPGGVDLALGALPPVASTAGDGHAPDGPGHLEFVEVDARPANDAPPAAADPGASGVEPAASPSGPMPPPIVASADPGWSFWGDPDR